MLGIYKPKGNCMQLDYPKTSSRQQQNCKLGFFFLILAPTLVEFNSKIMQNEICIIFTQSKSVNYIYQLFVL